MTREMRELQARLATVEQEARNLITTGEVAKAEDKMKEVRNLKAQITMLEELGAEEQRELQGSMPKGEEKDRKEIAKAYTGVFLKAVRNKDLSADDFATINTYKAVMHEGGVVADPNGDSSLVVPVDVQTRINELQRQMNDLSQYIRVEQVATLSGSRVLELDDVMVPFAPVAEYGNIQETDNPRFTPVLYTLTKRAGFLPLTAELLADSDQNILAYVINWLAKKGVVTKNTLITTLLNTFPRVDLTAANTDNIKRVLNVDLDPAVSANSIVMTNQTGFHWLDTLVDQNGRYLLQDDITRPGGKMLFARPVAVSSNRYLPNTVGADTRAPMIIGNLQQLAVLFTKGAFEIASTTVGGEAWRRDSLELRAISRDDVVTWDPASAVSGEIVIP